MKKRMISLLLTLCLLASPLSGLTFAAEDVAGFADVPADAYYAEAVQWAYERGVTTGKTTEIFGPLDPVTRGQAVTFLWRAFGKPEPETRDNPFADVSERDYFYAPVLWAVENGITNGTSANAFSPELPCSQAHILTFLYRVNGEPGKTGSGTWYDDAVAWAKSLALLTDGAVSFSPEEDCPRADVVTYLYRNDQLPIAARQAPLYIGSVYTDGDTVTALVCADAAAELMVEFLDEDTGAILATATAPTPAHSDLEPVTAEIDGVLPDHYLIRAVLRDGAGTALSAPFTSDRYTAAYEETAAQASVYTVYGQASIDAAATGTRGSVKIASSTNTPSAKDTHLIGAVDAFVEDGTLSGAAEIRIPYDKNKTHLDEATLLPGWYNPDTGEWETVPYVLDEENHQVVILTDHLSKFGLFEIERSGTRNAFAKPLSAARLATLELETSKAILGPFENGPVDPRAGDTMGEILEALDGSFNGTAAFGLQTYNTVKSRGGTVETPWIKKMGNICTVVGVVSSSISVANSAYKHGWTDSRTLQAMGNACIGLGVSALSAPVQYCMIGVSAAQMVYNYYDETQQTANNEQIQRLFWNWKAQQSWGKWKVEDWKTNRLDPMYDRYYVRGTEQTPYENYQDYLRRVRSVVSSYAHQFYKAYESGEVAEMFPNEKIPDFDDYRVQDAINLVCDDYEQQLGSYLRSYFLVQSRQCYINAVEKLDTYCETVRQEMNQTITINLRETVEEGDTPWTRNCYVSLGARKSEAKWSWVEWTENFDDAGKATLKFTGAAYMEIGCPKYLEVYNENTGDMVACISLGSGLDYGVNDVSFGRESFRYAVIQVAEAKTLDDYAYAGCGLRIRGQNGTISNEEMRLNDEAWCAFGLSLEEFARLEGPAYLEVLDETDTVIRTLPFDLSTRNFVLRATDMTVNISCKDEKTVKYYGGAAAELAAFEDGGSRTALLQSRLSANGTGVLVLPESAYDFYASREVTATALFLYGMGASKEESAMGFGAEERFALQFGKDRVCNILLSCEEEEKSSAPLRLAETSYTVYEGQSVLLNVESGLVGSTESSSPGVATAGSFSITGHKEGSASITLTDWSDPSNTVTIRVEVLAPPTVTNEGIYKAVLVREEIHYFYPGGNNIIRNMPGDYDYWFCRWSWTPSGEVRSIKLYDRYTTTQGEERFYERLYTPNDEEGVPSRLYCIYNPDYSDTYDMNHWAEAPTVVVDSNGNLLAPLSHFKVTTITQMGGVGQFGAYAKREYVCLYTGLSGYGALDASEAAGE